MAKAVFSKGQRVFVKPVGVWAHVDRILPQWVKGVEEPLKVFYDVGLGREFQSNELAPEQNELREPVSDYVFAEDWRLARVRNRWVSDTEAARNRHPHPGTYPAVITDERDWGGWRVSAAEYDRDPLRIEFQARVFCNALRMLRVTREIARFATEYEAGVPDELKDILSLAEEILTSIYQPDPSEPKAAVG